MWAAVNSLARGRPQAAPSVRSSSSSCNHSSKLTDLWFRACRATRRSFGPPLAARDSVPELTTSLLRRRQGFLLERDNGQLQRACAIDFDPRALRLRHLLLRIDGLNRAYDDARHAV